MREKLYYVKTGLGCGIRSDVSKEQVYKDELASAGSYIDWVRSMGGYIPNENENL